MLADRVAASYRKAGITPPQRAMLALALRMAAEPSDGEADFDALHARFATALWRDGSD